MNQKELNEIRRRFRLDKNNFSRIFGCYVNSNREVISWIDASLGLMRQEEQEMYLGLLKKTLSGTLGRNLIDIEFSTAQVADSDEHRLLQTLRQTECKDANARETLCRKIIESLNMGETNCLILLAADAYDVPYRGKDDELQADAIVKLQLGRLAGLEILKIEQELGELREAIADYEDILANDEHVKRIVKTDLTALADKYGDERRTSIEAVSGEVDIEDLIPEETCVFTLTHEGYIKRTTLDTYQAQNRGGRGVQGMTQKDDDFTEELFVGSTHDYMLFMTNQGRVYRLKGYQVPEGSRTAKGSHIVNLLQLQEGEKVTLMLQQKAGVDEDNTYATMVTKQGLIKRTPLSQFRNIRKMGLIAIALNEGDSLVWSHLTKGDDEIIVATHDGAAIRFTEDGARSMGRTGHGVRVIKLREGDYVVGAGVCRPGANVLTISEEGKGRRSRIDDYRITKRGGLGIRNYSNGNVAGIKIVDDTDDLILISQNGILIRIHAADINVQSRYGSGVRVMRLVEDDKVAVVARVDRDNDAETAKIEDTGETDPTPEELAAIEAEELAQEAAEDAAPENETEE